MSKQQPQGAVIEGASPDDLALMVKGFNSPLSTAEIEKAIRSAETTATMKFCFHAWADIRNRGVNKNRANLKHALLPRMTLIPLYAHPVPVIRPINSGFSVGSVTPYGAFAGPGGVEVKQRSMMAEESATLIHKFYGHFGCLVLDSLTTEKDTSKAEAFLLFAAVMEATRPVHPGEPDGEQTIRGVDVCIEDLPEFLQKEAPRMLEYAFRNGVDFTPSPLAIGFTPGHFKLRPGSERKGLAMIGELERNVERAIDCALNEETGVLTNTRGQLQAAAAHVQDSKAKLDRLDEFLVRQFPSFSMDTAVERAQRATSSVVASIEDSTASSRETTQQMLELNAKALENQTLILEELMALRGKVMELEAKATQAA